MQFSRPRQRSNDDERILPLTNIVFLLLIFFMLAGQMSNPDAFAIQPPHSISQTQANSTGLLLQINTNGLIALEGKPIAPAKLKAHIGDYLAQHPKAEIRLKADGLTDAARVVAVMSVLREAGVERLRLLTTEAER